jgi:O-acetyl-ADP-ribose deacetylase (regulator of RNase III)
LESYLNASGTKLGLFADDTDPCEWTFLKRNDEQNEYDEISRSQFERELGLNPISEMLSTQTRLELIRGNIIETEVDAIVTTANPLLTRVSGVDESIWDAGGEEIEHACREIVEREGFRPEGQAVITTGGNLSAGHIIHAVGPIYDGKENSKADVLASCYKSSLRLAVENGIRSIAFPAISTGKNFRYPIEKATAIALKAVKEFVEQAHQNNEMVPEHIQFVLFDEEVYDCYVKEFSTLGLGLSCFIG